MIVQRSYNVLMNKKRYLAIIANGTYIALFSALTFA